MSLGSTRSALRWNAASLVGRQSTQIIVALVLARILGPESYGVISLATVYLTITVLILDQGLSAALIQKKHLLPHDPGAVATVNLLLALLLMLVTVCVSPYLDSFFGLQDFGLLINILGISLLLKAGAVTPRALLSRRLHFRPVAISEISGVLVGGIFGVWSALHGAEYWSLLYQTLSADLVALIVLLAAVKGPVPNLHISSVGSMLGFSFRVLGSNALTAVSRNADNVLIGKFLGATPLALYALGYKVLMLPVQLLGGVVSRSLFPSIARNATNARYIHEQLVRSTRMLAMTCLPGMALVVLGAPYAVPFILGHAWQGAVPVVQILALTGARQAIYSVTPPLMMGVGRADWQLRFAIVSVIVQLSGIIVGLPFGVVGVAIGYTIAGFVLTPLMIYIQKRLAGVSVREHLLAIFPPLHGTAWGVFMYIGISWIPLSTISMMTIGSLIFATAYLTTLYVFHGSHTRMAFADAHSVLRPNL